ncbi:hypothetical protein ES319_A11G105200v1 [Gossypium barbadense]|uniref:RAVE complex protein Rav1 C-terminal domain-containing protein n=4 Tax=Gossypium TaxID=3633 RepID=A0A5J5TKS0_GOSBA|nr:hypothetical protein ES319_A11G105200v1 [Gossypium barbadense]
MFPLQHWKDMAGAWATSTSQNATSISEVDPTDHLPLSLLRSQLIPPAPNRSESAIDWLPDFAGYSWVAYGSSSLLVISHFPSPLSSEQTRMGSIFRQVFEISSVASSPVTAVSWSPVRPSSGELAAASDNCICLFSHDSATPNSKGSFCWSQNAVLLQSTKVEAVGWTASGDGLIAGGLEVVLWKRKSKSWEIAWKFKADQPQNMVSASWSIEGPSAAAFSSKDLQIEGVNEASKSVLVFYSDGSSGFAKTVLGHPQPVSMLQWRPSSGKQLLRDGKHLRRHILLTCCLDGTIRLWSEIDTVRVKKAGSVYDQKTTRSFCVAAVIEIDNALRGTLGADIFFTWAMEIGGMVKTTEETNQYFFREEHKNEVGSCEWLIGFGPGKLVTFWAIHCLDDISPMRFPRVTLWKRLELQGLEVEHLNRNGLSTLKQQLLLKKVVIMRNCASGPPIVCSSIHLYPCKYLAWSMLYTQMINDTENAPPSESRTENLLSCSVGGILDIDGHTSKILQVAIHPNVCEVDLVVSLDSNGLLLFWSLSNNSNAIHGLPTLIPAWRISGKHVTHGKCSKYSSLNWAPLVLAEDRFLLLGHVGGIDCFAVKNFHGEGDGIECYFICTIPFAGHDPYEDGPTNIYTVPLSLSRNETYMCDGFLLLGIWMKEFRALSWEITMHAYDLTRSCSECNFNDDNIVECNARKFEKTISGTRYCLHVTPSSAQLPEPHLHDQVTSFAVISPGGLTPVQQKLPFHKDSLSCRSPAYVMATGCFDGSIKLWRCSPSEPSISHKSWELVGMFSSHQGPVTAIQLTSCGRKIATTGSDSPSNTVFSLRIWDSICLPDSGTFMLEDTLSLDEDVVVLNWLALGNGQLLLAVCMRNELRVYIQKRCGGHALLDSKQSPGVQFWFCIGISHTFSAIHDFLWGPRTTGVVVHASYLSLLSPWLFLLDNKHQTDFYKKFNPESLLDSDIDMGKGTFSEIFSDHDVVSHKETLIANSNGGCKSDLLKKINTNNGHLSSAFLVGRGQIKCKSNILLGYWSMLDIVERVLPVYHPESLFANIYSGNWKRAYISVKHLVEYLNSSHISEKRGYHPKISDIVPQMPLSDYIEGILSKSSTVNAFQWNENATSMTSSSQFQSGLFPFAYNFQSNASSNAFSSSSTKSGLVDFLEPINKLHELAAITATEKMQILAIVDLLNEVSNPQSASVYENLDEPGRRFWVTLRFQQLLFLQRFGRSASLEDLVVDSGLIAWAFHSDCQETLFGSFLPNEPSWPAMQTLGIGFWFTNATQLRTRVEKLARMQYLKKKDPKDCTLLYVALNRLQVLAGLFKISKDEKDKPLVGFLSRNFQEEKNKAAALKNAYVLMGRHQLELAIAFFLLGGDASSAVTVCAKNLGDEQLALVICRLVEGRGGPLERHLITKLILPSAIERSDYWLASLLEWELGNYSQSFLTMLGLQGGSAIGSSTLSSCHVAFMDPSIGLYCLMLANKTILRNAAGDQNAGVLARWASLMTATSLNRCGLPLEALECLSSSLSILGGTDRENVSDFACSKTSLGILKPSIGGSSPWLLGGVASHLESYAKFDLALRYISKLMREHPSWPRTSFGSVRANTCSEDYENQYDKLLENFHHKLHTGLAQFEHKFSLVSSYLINMIFVNLCNNGFWFLGYDMLHGFCREHSQHENHMDDNAFLYPLFHKPLLKLTEDISSLFSHFLAVCSTTWSPSKLCYRENGMSHEGRSNSGYTWGFYFQGVKLSLSSLRAAMRIFSGIFKEVMAPKLLTLLDLYEFYANFASAWLQKNSEGLVLMMQPLIVTYTSGHTPYEVDMMALKETLNQVPDTVTDVLIDGLEVDKCAEEKQVGELLNLIPEDERWHIIGAFVWQHMSRFMKHKLNSLAISDDSFLSGFSNDKLSSCAPLSLDVGLGNRSIRENIRSASWILANLPKIALEHISSHHVKQLGLFLQQKIDNGFNPPTLGWLAEYRLSSRTLHQHLGQTKDTNSTNQLSASDILWKMCADPTMISESFAQEKVNWSSFLNFKPCRGWDDLYKDIRRENESDESQNHEGKISNSSSGGEAGSPSGSVLRNGHAFLSSWQKGTSTEKEVIHFQNPKEIYKRNGELLEALCVNSINQRQAALASNRKGIIFFNWEDGIPYKGQSDYIWSGADWPHNGWAGCESTPVPTCVSPGVGLGNQKGAHLGLGGATIGVDTFSRPGRHLTGGGAFGIPGYAGIGASGLGWETQEDFEEFVDLPATVENISTRSFSSHPSRPLFLVGSINTHIYLWEFGKDKATATYGVLPAANVAPPYALASISALEFDRCGHRFVTAALDGTVCTWQLEVGGRSNIRPTESSLCFNNHASDVTYITSSGSVIAAAGCSSNGVNVVIWDTLAPSATSRASIVCHEGGARSIAVFDNDIGSGSVSPLIVTGGKNGDVGLHDFRYIATGKTKRHRHHDSVEISINTSSNADMKTGASKQRDQNHGGMLWYIPKAHLGSITKISTIPNTSLFLTGSKDGNVKLWDAKAAKLVHHWSKLHERHTFLQPSSRGFGGVVRAAVTDIQVVSHGFLSCGGDGSVKLVQLND